MKDYKQIEHLRKLNDSLIWDRMKRCYDYGYEDGMAQQRNIQNWEEVINKATIDAIRTEIEQLTSRYSISKERGGMGQVEWSDRLIKESDVLDIIDKYTK